MALSYLYSPLHQFQDVRGVNNVAGWIEVFISGTQERAVAYSDFSGTLLPDRIPIDNDGRAVVIVDSEQAYRVEVHSSNGGLLFTQYPVWTQQSGGGVGDLTVIESSDASVAIEKSVIGSVTTYDLSVAQDSTELLDWVKTDGYTVDGGNMVPTYSSGTMDVGSHGVILRKGMYYHVTARYMASVTAMPSYNEFSITFAGRKSGGTSETYVSKYDIADCSTQLHQEYEVSFDAMPSDDVELYASVSGLATGVSVGLLDMEIHRVYSGIPAIPEGVASKEWVSGNYQEKLTAGANIVIENNVISSTAEPQLNADWDATSGVQEILHKPDMSVYARSADLSTVATTGSYDDLLDKPEIPGQVNADWDATSGVSEILHKPDLSVYAEKTELEDYQEKLTAGAGIAIDADNVISVTDNGVYVVEYSTDAHIPLSVYDDAYTAYTEGKTLVFKDSNMNLCGVLCGYVSGAYGLIFAVPTANITQSTCTDGWVRFYWLNKNSSYSRWGQSQLFFVPHHDAADAGKVLVASSSSFDSPEWQTLPDQLNADWDATSGVSMILNKPVIPAENVFVATYGSTTYQELSNAKAAGKAIFVTGVSGALSAIMPMTSFSTNPAMVIFTTVIGDVEYQAKIDQGVWSSTTVSMQADWNEASQLSPAYIANKPTIPAAQVNSDWDATSGIAQILNRPEETTLVAGDNITITESGNTVTISASASAAQVNADWDATSGVAQVLNKPDLSVYELVANKKQSIDANSTTEYPSSKATADFVNSSVATNTAKFLGNFTLTDLGLSYGATNAQIATALDGYTWPVGTTPTNNDYVYVEIQNPQTTGIDDEVRRFKYNGSNWAYEYTLNNSSFTAAEKAAIDSGITSSDVSTYDAHVSNTDIHVTTSDKSTWNGKQDAISDLETIRSGASAGATAVQPGDLATVATTGDYDDLLNKPNIPTVDQTYSSSSANAQSGTAVAGAIAGVRQVPSSSSSDEGKVLTVDSQGSVGWVTPVVIGTIDLTPQPDPTPTPEPSGNWTECIMCGGTGIYYGDDYEEPCTYCGGTGLVCAACGGSGTMVTDEYETCGECGGTGMVDYGEGDETCPTCCGTGTVPIEETCSSCEGVGHPTT